MSKEPADSTAPRVMVEPAAPWEPALQPVWSDETGCWCTSDHWVFRYDYGTSRLRKVFRLPRKSDNLTGRIKDVLARSWLRRRFAPGVGIDTLVQLAGGDLVLMYDQVYWYSPSHHGREARPLPFTGQPALASPLRGGAAVHAHSQCVYFGEYLNGHQRDIRVARVDVARQSVEVCWTFSRSDIKHVHAIHYDRFRNRLWICTGDLDHESAIWYTDDEFQTVHRFAGGDQTWRAIAMLFDETGMEWGMDAGKDAPATALNKIFRYEFMHHCRSEVAEIGNPAYSAIDCENGQALMQVAFEPGRQQDTPAKVGLWMRNKEKQWSNIYSLSFDGKRGGCGTVYGMILLPGGKFTGDQILCAPINCGGKRNGLLRVIFVG